MTNANGVVLYVEDEESDRFLMWKAFKKEGLDTALHMVSDGRLAVDYLSGAGAYADRQAHPEPGVVLLDLNLPEIHGFDVLKWIRADPRHSTLPVVVFTSSDRDEDSQRAKLLGANEFWPKPHSVTGLQEVARRLGERWLNTGQAKMQ
jgi:two-component system response regulator